jgi:cell division protein FtsZ
MGWDYLIRDALSTSPEPAYGDFDLNIHVVGVGGAGCNQVRDLFDMNMEGVTLTAINTDEVHMRTVRAHNKMVIGRSITDGRGTGGNPEVGARAAVSAAKYIYDLLTSRGTPDIIFVLAGAGGGTGSGAGPEVVRIASKTKALVISIVTMPFSSEGRRRCEVARETLKDFREHSDTVIVLENDRLLRLDSHLNLKMGFRVMNYLIAEMIRNISDTVRIPSLMNVDFADLYALMKGGGLSTILYGEGTTMDPQGVVTDTLNTPLMDVDYTNATGALIQIVGGETLTLRTVTRIVQGIAATMRDDAEIKIGTRVEEDLGDVVRVTTILTGVHSRYFPQDAGRVESAGVFGDPLLSII